VFHIALTSIEKAVKIQWFIEPQNEYHREKPGWFVIA
jgi:hypothetical protein